jgi:methylmalonyl-CoA/ethylmalonyl-CoA epimerase
MTNLEPTAPESRVPALPGLTPHHVSISVPDIDAAIRWYSDILGFEAQSRFGIAAISAQGAFLRRGTFWLELWQIGEGAKVPQARREPDSDLKTGGTKHLAFLVPQLQSRLTELVRLNVDIAAIQRDPTEPMKHEDLSITQDPRPAFAAFIRDPAGTLIELLDHAAISAMHMI